MTIVGQTIRQRRLSLGLTLDTLALASQCSKAYLSAIENDRLDNPPRQSILERIEQALAITSGELIRLANWQRTPQDVRADYQRMADANQQLLHLLKKGTEVDGESTLDALYQSGELKSLIESVEGNINPLPGAAVQVPLINNVAAGYPTDFTDLDYPASVADEYVSCSDVTDPDAFAARVVGQSMMPQYREGDVIVFSPGRQLTDGVDCFVRLLPDHHTTFKRIYFEEDNHIRLQPLNPSFKSQVVDLEEVSGIYPAVYRMQKIG